VSPGHGGSFCLQAVTTGSTTYGITDNPNLITNVTAVGVMYHLTAWVRSPSSHGAAKIKVREFANGTQQGNSAYSNGFTLTTAWQQISFDYSTRKAGSYLDIEINDYPVSSGETIQIDDIAITRTAVAGVEDGHGASFAASLSPNPMRSGGELRFTITRPGPVRVDLYDLAGRRVASPLNASYLPAGRHAVTFTTALQLSAGCYFYRLEAVEGARQGRFVILE
jgi:hypothetical protein